MRSCDALGCLTGRRRGCTPDGADASRNNSPLFQDRNAAARISAGDVHLNALTGTFFPFSAVLINGHVAQLRVVAELVGDETNVGNKWFDDVDFL